MKKLLVLMLLAGCGSKQSVSALDADGCTLCHQNITNAHPKAVVLCTSCHGQNQDPSAKQRFSDAASSGSAPTIGSSEYQQLIDDAHTPAQNPEFWLANGQSKSRGACFNASGGDLDCNLALTGGSAGDPVAKNKAQKSLGTVDDAIDSEYSRDLNYLRFINPGDLRVAHAGCGGGNPQAGDYTGDGGVRGGCHAEEVFRVRRSIMTGNSSVVTAAFIGNRGQTAGPVNDRTGNVDPRGYMFNLDLIDSCFQNGVYNRDCLTMGQFPMDDPVSATLPGNQPAFEAFPGTIMADPSLNGTTMPHSGWAPRIGGVGGQPLDGSNAPHDHLSAPDNSLFATQLMIPPAIASTLLCAMATPAIDPVDAILRGFRAYYPLWLAGTGKNFGAVAGNTLNPDATGIAKQTANNPFGRGHGSGCTGCHMLYDNSGASQETGDPAVMAAGRNPSTDLPKGMSVAQQLTGGFQQPNPQQRFYPQRHRLTSRIPTRQCGLCHTFVTRIDLAYQGLAEVEEKSTLARANTLVGGTLDATRFPSAGDIELKTPNGTRALIIDNSEVINDATKQVFADPRMQAMRSRLRDVCSQNNIDCDNLAIYSPDLNDNGELDDDERAAFQDVTGGELWLPDRIPRDQSVDGRQVRLLYGGKSGTTHLKDMHLARGMHCIDCHFYQDVHGDGNIYTDNWEQIEVECEDCHGFANTPAWVDDNNPRLLTSGPNGGNDMFGAKDEFGRPFFELRDGDDGKKHLFQRSRVTLQDIGEVKQVRDSGTMAPAGASPSADPHSDKHIPTGPKDKGKLECYSCHNTFAMNCLACHYQQNFNQNSRQQAEVFLTGGAQTSHTNFQLFGLVRGPLILAVNGNAEQNRLAPFRSTMEAYVSVTNCAGDTLLGNVVHSNCREADKQPVSGVAMNNFMPHSVRDDVVRGCETCHPATQSGHVINNPIVAQTMGLGTGRLNMVGDWLYVASAGALDVLDVKDEGELTQFIVDPTGQPIADTSDKNSFPGFVVGNRTTPIGSSVASLRRQSIPSGDLQDVVLVRGWNGALCSAEQPLNPDLALAADGTTGLRLFDVTAPDVTKPFAITLTQTGDAAVTRAFAIDHLGPDISDPRFFVADQAGFAVVDLSGLSWQVLAPPAKATAIIHRPSGWSAGAGAGVKLIGTDALVGVPGGLAIVDVKDPTAPAVEGAVLPLCTASEGTTCGRAGGRITAQGTLAYVATNTGVVAVDVHDAMNPTVLGVAKSTTPVEDVAISGHLLFAAAGAGGLLIFDVTDPQQPVAVTVPPIDEVQPDGSTQSPSLSTVHGVIVAAIPTQTWLYVADGVAGVHAINVSPLYDPYLLRNEDPRIITPGHGALTLEVRDPFSPRDTTSQPLRWNAFQFPSQGTARRIARGAMLDRLVDESGRRLRDAWNPGSGVMSRALMDNLRANPFPLSP